MNRHKERMKEALEKEHFNKSGTDTWEKDHIRVCYITMLKKFFMCWGKHEIEVKTQDDLRVAFEMLNDRQYNQHKYFWGDVAQTYHHTRVFNH